MSGFASLSAIPGLSEENENGNGGLSRTQSEGGVVGGLGGSGVVGGKMKHTLAAAAVVVVLNSFFGCCSFFLACCFLFLLVSSCFFLFLLVCRWWGWRAIDGIGRSTSIASFEQKFKIVAGPVFFLPLFSAPRRV